MSRRGRKRDSEREKTLYYWKLSEWSRSLDLWLRRLADNVPESEGDPASTTWRLDFGAYCDSLAAFLSSLEDFCARYKGERVRLLSPGAIDDLFGDDD